MIVEGGDGVEFYLTLPNGDQWGWQAKYYVSEYVSESDSANRLNASRKRSIKNSLKRACEIHPSLKKWFLCTPTNFTSKEQEWFNDTLPQSIPDEMCVELKHWGKSDFNNWMSKERFSGKRHYFFGELELNLNWFQRQFNKQKAWIGMKFDSSLHTETDADAEIHALLGDETFAHQITEWIKKLERDNLELKEAINDFLKSSVLYEIEWNEDEKLKVIGAAKSLQNSLQKTILEFKQARKLLNEKRLSEAQAINWELIIKRLKESLETYRTVEDESGMAKISYIGAGREEYEQQVLRNASWLVYHPDSLISNVLDDFHYSVKDQCELINQPDLHIFGDAGIGKTHIACNICEDRLKNGLPALFIRGSLFTTEKTLEKQLQDILDISPYFNWEDFLQALSAAAEAYHTRIPLVIDGLNESTHNGAFSKVWELYLKGLVHEIAQTKNVVLITTCRTSYKDAIWDDEYPPNSTSAVGFDTEEIRQEAINKYFNTYEITSEPTLAPFMQFEHPIYLKIFCETKRCTSDIEEPVYVGEETLFEIFEEYLNVCNKEVCKHLKLHRGTSVVGSELNKIAEYLWKHRCRHIPFDELIRLVDGQSREELEWESSKTRALIAEGLLLYQDWGQFGDAINVTYDLLGGYLMAQYLIRQSDHDMKEFVNSQETVSTLFSENYRTLHPLSKDIARSLAALIPVKTGKYLHDLTDNKIARYFSIRALFEISPQYITTDCKNQIAHIFSEKPETRKPLFELAETTIGHPNHPFKASFWSKQLSALSMVERDLSWSEHIRKNRDRFEKIVIRIEETCQNQDISELRAKRLHLLAEHIMWILTSTVRPLRDKATRALYWYGRRFPQEFFKLVVKSFTINDPYVSERMLAAIYGIAMARQNDFEDTSFVDEVLPLYARQLYENMFKPDALYATTHILARDYAKRTIDIALIHHPDLLTDDEREHITPPFTDGGIRQWSESENKEEGPPPIQMDFDIYTLKRLIKYDSSDPNEHKRVKGNVYWRMYDLKFSLEDFREIDKWISEENWRHSRYNEDARKIDRYGKKYSWIAFYELAGFRQDNNLLPDRYDEGRISDADIDPSFPAEEQMYNLVTKDFLGDREVSAEEWISKTPPSDLTNYLKIDRLCDEEESCDEEVPWVLLHGYLRQEDKQVNRNMFVWLQGLIVKSEKVKEIVATLRKQQEIDAHIIPSDYRTYAGEIPWCGTYPLNSWQELSFKTGVDLVEKQKLVLEQSGEPLSEQAKGEFRESIKNLTVEGDLDTIVARLHEQNIECKIETVEIEEPQYQKIEVLVPVRENIWEESCSAANIYRSIALPAREITESLRLCKKSDSFDLFEKESNRRASISFRCGEKWGEVQHFTYLRKDLLERYLAEIDGELIWVIWGNRRLVSQNPDDPYENFQEVKTYRDIQEASGNS